VSQANAKINPSGVTTEVVARAVAGDRDAFATLYNEYRRPLIAFLYKRTYNRVLAEDLVQETFAKAFARIGSFRQTGSDAGFAAWLFTIARNTHLDYARLHSTKREIPSGDRLLDDIWDSAAEEAVLAVLDAEEARQLVTEALEALPPYQREALRMRYFEGLTPLEASVRVGKAKSSIGTATLRGIRALRAALPEVVAA